MLYEIAGLSSEEITNVIKYLMKTFDVVQDACGIMMNQEGQNHRKT